MIEEVDILLVEDSKVDAELIAEALKDAQFPHRLNLAYDGAEALRFLRASTPHLVLLDLNLPKVHGIDVLKDIRRDPKLCVVPVVVLTNSRSQDDITRCYSNFCNAYIRKPIGFDRLASTLKQTGEFWFRTVTLPKV